MRAMSFMLTEPQIVARTKTVTRRLGWAKLKPGDRLRAVRKAMGLKKGEKQVQLGVIEVTSCTRQCLDNITKSDCIAEGFPEMEPRDFVAMFMKHMNCSQVAVVNRIEFKYVEE